MKIFANVTKKNSDPQHLMLAIKGKAKKASEIDIFEYFHIHTKKYICTAMYLILIQTMSPIITNKLLQCSCRLDFLATVSDRGINEIICIGEKIRNDVEIIL